MKIVVAVKSVAALDDEFELSDGGSAVDPDFLEWELNEWDAFSLEEALTLRDGAGEGEVVAITVGDRDAGEVLLSALAKGADRGLRIWDDALEGADPLVVARVLAAAVEREAPDLVLCGVQSSDAVNGATGDRARRVPRPAARRGRQEPRLRRRERRRDRRARARGRARRGAARAHARGADDPDRHQPAALRDAARDQAGAREAAGRRGPRRARARRGRARTHRRIAPAHARDARSQRRRGDDRRVARRGRGSHRRDRPGARAADGRGAGRRRGPPRRAARGLARADHRGGGGQGCRGRARRRRVDRRGRGARTPPRWRRTASTRCSPSHPRWRASRRTSPRARWPS